MPDPLAGWPGSWPAPALARSVDGPATGPAVKEPDLDPGQVASGDENERIVYIERVDAQAREEVE